jgi:hypothetical protein
MGEWRYSSTILDLDTRWRWVVCLLLASWWFLAWLIILPWIWRRPVPPERLLTFNGLDGVISQKTQLFTSILNPMRNQTPGCVALLTYSRLRSNFGVFHEQSNFVFYVTIKSSSLITLLNTSVLCPLKPAYMTDTPLSVRVWGLLSYISNVSSPIQIGLFSMKYFLLVRHVAFDKNWRQFCLQTSN